MDTLLPSIQEALTVHDAAHKEQSEELHGVALKLLALCDQTHICMDALDQHRDRSAWDDLPGAIMVDAEAAAIVGDFIVSEMVLPAGLPGKKMLDRSFQHKSRTPAYELWMVKKWTPEKITPDCAFTAGKYVPVGWPRKRGTYHFPAVAQKMPEEYQLLQVHKAGEIVSVFDKNGEEPAGLANLVDVFVGLDFPETAILECVWSEEGVQLFDVLMLDGIDCTKLPWSERDKLLAETIEQNECWPEDLVAAETLRLPRNNDLHHLEAGTWIIRWEQEVLSALTSLMRPFWFIHEAGTVNVGTVLPWVHPSEKVDDPSGYIRVMDTGLPPIQIHKNSRGVNVFVGEGGRDRSANVPQIVELAQALPEEFIIEAMVSITDGELPVSAHTVKNPTQDLSGCQIKLHPYDVVLYGDEHLAKRPMYERVELLEGIVLRWDREEVEMGVSDDGSWLFVADSERPLDGSLGHCFQK